LNGSQGFKHAIGLLRDGRVVLDRHGTDVLHRAVVVECLVNVVWNLFSWLALYGLVEVHHIEAFDHLFLALCRCKDKRFVELESWLLLSVWTLYRLRLHIAQNR
jgi:hypothetical protein